MKDLGDRNILTPIKRVAIARQSSRLKGFDVIKAISSSLEVLHGDRSFGDDKAVVCGSAVIEGKRVIFIAQHKGSSIDERHHHNFGMMKPEGFTKALRVMKLAQRFGLPVLTIVDTPGAYPGLDAEKRGQASAIAENLFEMSHLKTPIISLVLGEGSSGGALGVCISDRIIMLEHAYFSVISPEGCASILWKDAKKKDQAAAMLKMQSEDLLKFGMIDEIIKEGEGFHLNSESVLDLIKERILQSIKTLTSLPVDELIDKRYKKYRTF